MFACAGNRTSRESGAFCPSGEAWASALPSNPDKARDASREADTVSSSRVHRRRKEADRINHRQQPKAPAGDRSEYSRPLTHAPVCSNGIVSRSTLSQCKGYTRRKRIAFPRKKSRIRIMGLRAPEALWRANSCPADGDHAGRAVAFHAPNFLLPMRSASSRVSPAAVL